MEPTAVLVNAPPQPIPVASIADLVMKHAWIPLAALVINFVVRLLKSPNVPAPLNKIPAQYRPLLVVGLGVVSGVLDAIIGGTPWKVALVGGIVSAALAILNHQVVIEGFRGGREVLQSPVAAAETAAKEAAAAAAKAQEVAAATPVEEKPAPRA